MTREVIATVERRRKWPDEEKVRIMSEALAPGATASAVADRNGVCRSLLYAWLRLARRGELAGISLSSPKDAAAMQFAAVEIAGPRAPAVTHEPVAQTPAKIPATLTACAPVSGRRRSTWVEVVLANGRIVKVDESIDPAALARLIAVLDGAPA
jgi:transposase